MLGALALAVLGGVALARGGGGTDRAIDRVMNKPAIFTASADLSRIAALMRTLRENRTGSAS
ncbi:MAG TPA: hypothetical protein VK326_10615 [Solirubrobacterales bacterium]|nr:hypothetical protein [Solirubrobacterales bacterium]